MNLNLQRFNYRDLAIFVVPLMIFSLYLFIFNPGILTVESFSQLHQIATGHINNAQPVLHTYIEMICIKLFGTPLIIGVLQILVFSLIWTLICNYHRDDSQQSSNHFVVQFIITLAISLIPINAANAITLSSYVLFSYFLMFLCFLIKVMVDKRGNIDHVFIAIMAVTMALVAGLHTYGACIAVISLIAITVYLYKTNKNYNTFIMLPALTIVLILLVTALSFTSAEDTSFNIESSDEIIDLEAAKGQFFTSIHDSPKKSYEDLNQENIRNDNYNSFNSIVSAFKGNIILNLLFSNPIVYLVLSVALLFFIQTIIKTWDMYFIYAPSLINIIIGFVTSPAHLNLSLYAAVLVFYVIVIVFVSIWAEGYEITAPQTPRKQEVPQNNYTSSYYNSYSSDNSVYGDFEAELEQLSLDDINAMLGKTTHEEIIPQEETLQSDESESDLIDEILKEIEMEKD